LTKARRKGASNALLCRNWECGVVIRGKALPISSATGKNAVPSLDDMFEGVVDIPFLQDDLSYEGKQPWFFNEPATPG
jgi:hypothetical protein